MVRQYISSDKKSRRYRLIYQHTRFKATALGARARAAARPKTTLNFMVKRCVCYENESGFKKEGLSHSVTIDLKNVEVKGKRTAL
jgi:hypothetical protein